MRAKDRTLRMKPFERGCYRARLAESPGDIAAALALRQRLFRADSVVSDRDAFDAQCLHVLVETRHSGEVVCCFRVLPVTHPEGIQTTYAAQFYDLKSLAGFDAPMLEMGRFCVAPGCSNPDIFRMAWAALGRIVDALGAELLFGCSSFRGTDADAYRDAFALLKEQHMAPPCWQPGVKAPAVVHFARKLAAIRPDIKRATRGMPPLLRSYLALGGWVSDHAVVDPDLDTLHVFTGLEIRSIPPVRARLLRGSTP